MFGARQGPNFRYQAIGKTDNINEHEGVTSVLKFGHCVSKWMTLWHCSGRYTREIDCINTHVL